MGKEEGGGEGVGRMGVGKRGGEFIFVQCEFLLWVVKVMHTTFFISLLSLGCWLVGLSRLFYFTFLPR